MPTRGQRIARALGRAHDKLRSVFLEGVCLKLYETGPPYSTPTATFTSHWYLDKHEYSDVVAGKKYKRLVVEDVEGCRVEKLRGMVAVQVGDTIYKVNVKDSFIGSVPSYEFRLSPTGERV